jgi:hypothetical protein
MLRRKPSDTALLDAIDLTILRAVEAGSTWRAILQSCTCHADETQLRVLRLIHSGHLEGKPGDAVPSRAPLPSMPAPSAPARATASTIAPRAANRATAPSASAAPTATRKAPSAPAESVAQGKTVPPSARAARDALLRELSTRRASTSYPPVRVSEAPAPIAKSPLPGYYSLNPGSAERENVGSARPPISERALGPAVISSVPPGRYSQRGDEPASAHSSTPPRFRDSGFDSPLAALVDEFSRGHERDRWCADRLRDALREELSGNVQQAISILQSLTVQLNDPRIVGERDRLQARSLKVTSGVYRSRALLAERADKHKEAAESWRKVLEACPDDAEAALHAAKCSMEFGDLRQAGLHARRAVELAPDSVAAHRLLWRFFRKTGMDLNANREREILKKLSKGDSNLQGRTRVARGLPSCSRACRVHKTDRPRQQHALRE